ncbi:MAG: hypothetical protein H6742_21185 [Alphaproteobacteria bacterium]|nr:hypothetical protein [Alphaproteobacteria bacterium]
MKRGKGRPGSRKPQRGPSGDQGAREQLKQQAEALVRDTGIPRPWAFQVARGEVTLNDVLKRLSVHDRVDQLVRRHGLDRSLAFQVARGEADLDAVLERQRRVEHVDRNKERSVLLSASTTGDPLTLHLHGLTTRTGRIVAVRPFEIDVDDGSGPVAVHKLDIKLAHADGVGPTVDEIPGGRVAAQPVKRPQDRWHLSDKRAFAALDSGRKVRLTSLEGDVVTGTLTWVGRWELGLRQGSGGAAIDLVFFRHALSRFEEL